MQSLAIADAKPKIHRPPAFLAKKSRKVAPIPRGAVIMAGLFLAAAGAYTVLNRQPAAVVENETGRVVEPTVVWAIPEKKPEIDQKFNNIIVLKGSDGGIVGQLTRIRAGSESIQETKITEAKNVTYIDKNAASELLSIVNKY